MAAMNFTSSLLVFLGILIIISTVGFLIVILSSILWIPKFRNHPEFVHNRLVRLGIGASVFSFLVCTIVANTFLYSTGFGSKAGILRLQGMSPDEVQATMGVSPELQHREPARNGKITNEHYRLPFHRVYIGYDADERVVSTEWTFD